MDSGLRRNDGLVFLRRRGFTAKEHGNISNAASPHNPTPTLPCKQGREQHVVNGKRRAHHQKLYFTVNNDVMPVSTMSEITRLFRPMCAQ